MTILLGSTALTVSYRTIIKHRFTFDTVYYLKQADFLWWPGKNVSFFATFYAFDYIGSVSGDAGCHDTLMDILDAQLAAGDRVWLAPALAELAGQEQYLALEIRDWRYDVGARYGLLIAQLALALSGRDRDQVLTRLLELLALREMGASEEGG